MATPSFDQIMSVAIETHNAEAATQANNKVANSLGRVGQSFATAKGEMEKSRALMSVFGVGSGVIGGAALGQLTGVTEAPSTFLGQTAHLLTSIGVFSLVARKISKDAEIINASNQKFLKANSEANKIWRRDVKTLAKNQSISATQAKIVAARQLKDLRRFRGDALNQGTKLAQSFTLGKTLLNRVGGFVMGAIIAELLGAAAGRIFDNMSEATKKRFEDSFKGIETSMSDFFNSVGILIDKNFSAFGKTLGLAPNLAKLNIKLSDVITPEKARAAQRRAAGRLEAQTTEGFYFGGSNISSLGIKYGEYKAFTGQALIDQQEYIQDELKTHREAFNLQIIKEQYRNRN